MTDDSTDNLRPGWICTITGRRVWPLDLRPEDVSLADIAGALAKQCRFAGHCRELYTVAQHSVLVAEWLELHHPEHALRGLFHDAAETYLGDLPGPVKHARGMEGYRHAEAAISLVIAEAFGLPREVAPEIQRADQVVFAAEVRDLMHPAAAAAAPTGVAPLQEVITAWSPPVAEEAFRRTFARLAG